MHVLVFDGAVVVAGGSDDGYIDVGEATVFFVDHGSSDGGVVLQEAEDEPELAMNVHGVYEHVEDSELGRKMN